MDASQSFQRVLLSLGRMINSEIQIMFWLNKLFVWSGVINLNQLFRVPTMDPNRSKWIEAIEKIQPFDYITQTYYVCQFHFLPEDIEKRGKKKFVISGRAPSIFSSQSNENVNSNVSVIEVNGNSCETTIPVNPGPSNVENTNMELIEVQKVSSFDSGPSSIQCPNILSIEANGNSCDATIPDSTDVQNLLSYYPESENSSNSDHEIPNQTISGNISSRGCIEDTILITKAEYKKLMDEMVELAKMKIKISRMENSLKEKSNAIYQLKQKVRCFEYMKAKEISEENGGKNTNQNPGTQTDNSDEYTLEVIKIHSDRCVFIYPRHYYYFRNLKYMKFWNVC